MLIYMRSRGIPAAAVVVVLSAIAGGLFGSKVVAGQDRLMARYRMYEAALQAVKAEYVEALDNEQIVYGSIDGLLRTLDPHSSFLDPKSFAQMRERQEGRYPGIGISILSVQGNITVMSLFEGSPAYRAGIRRGDIIARVGKEDTTGWTTDEVVKRVRGPRGTTVDLSIRRPGVDQLIPLTVERDEIKITTVRTAFMVAPGIGYVRLQDFSETTDTELGEALKKLKAAGMDRLVLDLRSNPGGPLDQAIAVSNRFLKRGQMIVYTRGRLPNSNEEYPAEEDGAYTALPLVVLTNRESASASEIVSGAMQDHDRGIIVGETTFGKALVQSVFPISGDAAVALTTGRYYTPLGRLIQRPWDGSFDEYLTYSLRDQNGSRQHDPADLKTTPLGRKVFGGGGIEPDHFIVGPVEGFNPSRFARMLRDRGAFIGFAERFTKQGDTRPAARAAKYTVAQGFEVTDAIVADFKTYVASQRVKVDEAAFQQDIAFIKAMIHFEVDNDLFSFEEARRNLIKVDPQAQGALSYFDEARQLLARRTQ
jgi:carboxyl-terminal processing protease